MLSPARWNCWLLLLLSCAVCGCGRAGIEATARAADEEPEAKATDTEQAAVAAAQGRRYALLVGCTSYYHLPPTKPKLQLKGGGNDVALLKDVLVERYAFAASDVKILSEAEADDDRPTCAHIVREFERLSDMAAAGDHVVVLLSGHGGQQPDIPDPERDDPEPDGLDEVFCPADIRPANVDKPFDQDVPIENAIVDDKIYDWTQRIIGRGASLWVILDCCHAGAGIRGDFGEVARFLASDDLGIPPAAMDKAAATARGAQRGENSVEVLMETTRGDGQRDGKMVVFYATQSDELERERPMPPEKPPGEDTRKMHGVLTYTLCSVLNQQGARGLTYRDVMRQIWARYQGWNRPETPFPDGTGLDEPLPGGAVQDRFDFVITKKTGKKEYQVNGGALHGWKTDTVLEVHPPAGEDDPDEILGHVRVAEAEIAESRVVPCEYKEMPERSDLPLRARCKPVFIEFGDMRLTVAVDRKDLPAGEVQQRLDQLNSDLETLAKEKTSPFRHTDDPTEADWVVQARPGGLELLRKSAASMPALPRGTPHFPIKGERPAELVKKRLAHICHAENLLKLASGELARGGDFDVDVKLEMLECKNNRDRDGRTIPVSAAGTQLKPEQWVSWRVSNLGRQKMDVTLLFIDSELRIHAAYPRPDAYGVNNRLDFEEVYTTPPARVTAETVGREHMLLIAVPSKGPQVDFRCLAEPTLRGALGSEQKRGGENVLEQPLGRLLRYALYNEQTGAGGATRGLEQPEIAATRLELLTWTVVGQ